MPPNRYTLLALVVAGCARTPSVGGETPTTAPTDNQDAEPVGPLRVEPDDAVRSTEPARPLVADIGIADCDEYLTKYWLCIEEKMPEDALATIREALDVTAEAWREVAAGPKRDELAGVCLSAIEAAKVVTEPFGCVW